MLRGHARGTPSPATRRCPAAYRQGLLLHRPPLFLLHALPAALADPQRHFSQEVLHERWHEVRRQPLAGGNQPIVGRPSPVLALAVAEQAARLHRLVGGGQPLRRDTRATSQPGARHGSRRGPARHQGSPRDAGINPERFSQATRGSAPCASSTERPQAKDVPAVSISDHWVDHAVLKSQSHHQVAPRQPARPPAAPPAPALRRDQGNSQGRAGPADVTPQGRAGGSCSHHTPSLPIADPLSQHPHPLSPPRPPLCSANPAARMRQGGEQPPVLSVRGEDGTGLAAWHGGGHGAAARGLSGGRAEPSAARGAPIVCGCGGPRDNERAPSRCCQTDGVPRAQGDAKVRGQGEGGGRKAPRAAAGWGGGRRRPRDHPAPQQGQAAPLL